MQTEEILKRLDEIEETIPTTQALGGWGWLATELRKSLAQVKEHREVCKTLDAELQSATKRIEKLGVKRQAVINILRSANRPYRQVAIEKALAALKVEK